MSLETVSPSECPSAQFPVLYVDGRPFPAIFDADHIRSIPNFRIRDDDVFICGFMRAGTHWTFEIINMLLHGTTDTVPDCKESLHLEHSSSMGKSDDYSSPRVLNSHMFFEDLPRQVLEKKTKIVYLIRDPRDCLISWHKCMTTIMKSKGNKNWSFPLEYWIKLSNDGKLDWGSWFQNIKSWETAIKDHPEYPIHVVFYEELRQDVDATDKIDASFFGPSLGLASRKDPVRGIVDLKDFLGLERDDEFCKQIANKTKLETMSKDKLKHTPTFGGEEVHFQKGEVGKWRSVFTAAMIDDFNRRYEAEMEGSRFKDRYQCS